METSEPSQLPMFTDGYSEVTWRPLMFASPQAHDTRTGDPSRVRRFGSTHGGRSLNDEIAAGIDPSISLPPGTRANPSLTPGSAWAKKMTVISGRRLLPLLANVSPVGLCLRMLLDTSLWGSTACWLTWKKWATPAGRLLFQLVPSVLPTDATGSGSSESLADELVDPSSSNSLWPTPRKDGFDASGHRGKADSLHKAVKLWPTATKSMTTGAGRQGRTGGPNLQTAVLLPTPTSQDGSNNGGPAQHDRNSLPLNATVNGKLSAAWVSRLMGYPDGWLDLES